MAQTLRTIFDDAVRESDQLRTAAIGGHGQQRDRDCSASRSDWGSYPHRIQGSLERMPASPSADRSGDPFPLFSGFGTLSASSGALGNTFGMRPFTSPASPHASPMSFHEVSPNMKHVMYADRSAGARRHSPPVLDSGQDLLLPRTSSMTKSLSTPSLSQVGACSTPSTPSMTKSPLAWHTSDYASLSPSNSKFATPSRAKTPPSVVGGFLLHDRTTPIPVRVLSPLESGDRYDCLSPAANAITNASAGLKRGLWAGDSGQRNVRREKTLSAQNVSPYLVLRGRPHIAV